MSKNIFYSDLDTINEKGVLVTGHGKGLVAANSIINGKYIANDMVRLTIKDNELFGFQGYIEKEDNELAKIEYLLYFYEQSEPHQPTKAEIINVEKYLSLSKHNIDTGAQIAMMSSMMFGQTTEDIVDTYSEYETILKQANNVIFAAVPYTENEDDRATFINDLIK
ncbi:hypothetical protein [Lysinibacillus sphaericus]|uniref:hypothetical protein n=1 Tax=Lysinibacillus sphaericus TaxID=1421 RepID=UPI003D090545